MRAMKDSGVEWIGEIPADWKIIRLKNIFLLWKGLSITKADLISEGIAVISYGQIHAKANTGTSINNQLIRYVDDDYLNSDIHALVQAGDLIFADTSEDYDGIGNCVYVDRNDKIFAGYHTIIAHPNANIYSKYLAYLFLTDCWRSQLRAIASGIKVFSITQRMLKTASILLPSTQKTQQRIADYLDDRCAKIDTLISQEQTVIKKLQEYKQSMITQVVTKGLDPDVPMKGSGVDWIGEIPENWNIVRLKYKFKIHKKIAKKSGYSVLSITQEGIKIKDLSHNEGQLATNYDNYQLVKKGDFAMNHMDLLTGWVDISPYDGVTSPDYRVFQLIDNDSFAPYYLYLFQMCYLGKIFYHIGQGVSFLGRWRLQADKFLNFNIPVPNYNEQQHIVNYLDSRCSTIDATISKKQTLIDKLTEYKKSLIYEVVTGKKEV